VGQSPHRPGQRSSDLAEARSENGAMNRLWDRGHAIHAGTELLQQQREAEFMRIMCSDIQDDSLRSEMVKGKGAHDWEGRGQTSRGADTLTEKRMQGKHTQAAQTRDKRQDRTKPWIFARSGDEHRRRRCPRTSTASELHRRRHRYEI